jgi:hypothetical protein
MEDEMERLRAMLENQAGWDKSTHFEPTFAASCHFSSDPDDDEKTLSFEHRVGGRLEHAIGHTEGKVTNQNPQKIIY